MTAFVVGLLAVGAAFGLGHALGEHSESQKYHKSYCTESLHVFHKGSKYCQCKEVSAGQLLSATRT